MSPATKAELKPGAYKTDLKPVWCPGCGDFGVLNALYRSMAALQIEPWNTVILSGIGCSSRLPGYVTTYGFNGVHGRALTLATGVKMARPELTVIAVGGLFFPPPPPLPAAAGATMAVLTSASARNKDVPMSDIRFMCILPSLSQNSSGLQLVISLNAGRYALSSA